jgi:hypothetical protein
MISSYLLQELTNDKPKGFARRGGTMRAYLHRLDMLESDWLQTLDYALKRGWMVETGQVDAAGAVYNWVYKNLLHLTLTGSNAGKPICGAPRLDGDRGLHYAYVKELPDDPDLCSECAAIYKDNP